MPSCPHFHQSTKQIHSTEGQSIFFCRDSCLRTFFFCPHCGEANRSLARFCRHCSEPIDYVRTEASVERSTLFKPCKNETYSLERFGLKEIRALESRLGFLFVIADNAILLFDTHSLHEPLKSIPSRSERAIRGVSTNSLPDGMRLLITTAESIYQLDFLDLDAAGTELYKVPQSSQSIYNSALRCADYIYCWEYDATNQTSKLIRLPDQVITTFKGVSRQPLTVLNDKIFFCTENELFLYDTSSQKLKTQKAPEHLNRFSDPAYSEELEAIYFVGENRFWRLSAKDSDLSAAPLNTPAVGDPRIASSGDKLFVARATGLMILNPFGDEQWDSSKNFISASSDLRPPRIFPNEVLFTSLGRMGGSDVRVHMRNNPNRFELVSYEKRLACSPVLSLGRLISVVGEDSALELKVT